jgi:hypothetical protein
VPARIDLSQIFPGDGHSTVTSTVAHRLPIYRRRGSSP